MKQDRNMEKSIMLNIVVPSLKLFENIQADTLTTILSTVKIKTYKKGTTWYDPQGENIACCYIMKGAIKLFKQTLDGKEVIIDVVEKSQFFGEQQLFEKPSDPYWVKVISPLQIMTWPFGLFKKLILTDHQLTLNLLKYKIEKQEELEHSIEHLTTQTVEQRISNFLLKFCNKQDTKKEMILTLPYEKSIIASILNMRPETFTRALHKICENCHITLLGSMLYLDSLDPLLKMIRPL
jgi:CRP-like cAMP-binding protein